MQTHTDLMELQTRFAELDLSLNTAKTQNESINDAKKQLNKQMQELQEALATKTSDNERMKRDLFTQMEINAQAEESFRISKMEMREKHDFTVKSYMRQLETKSMEYEDLRQLCSSQYNKILKLEAQIVKLEEDLQVEWA